MSNWVVVIGTGPSQEPLILNAKKLGFKVAGIDKTPNSNIIDYPISISTYDYDKALNAVKSLPFVSNIKGIIARVSGPANLTSAKISEYLNLPSPTLEIAKMSTSKSYLRKVAQDIGVSTIEGSNLINLPNWVEGSDFVIKPDQPVIGKKNVFRVTNRNDFIKAFELASNESLNNLVECQDYEDGTDIGLAIAVVNGNIIWSFLYEEIIDEVDGNFIGIGVRGPLQKLDKRICKKIIDSATRIIESLHPTGFIFFSYRLTPSNELKLYEINPGLCGDNIADKLFKKIWPATNFFELDIQLATNSIPNLPSSDSGQESSIYKDEI